MTIGRRNHPRISSLGIVAIRVRTFRTVNGTTVYSAWSSVVSVNLTK